LTESAASHVLNRDHNREPVFGDNEEFSHFLSLLVRYRALCDASVSTRRGNL
jgi:hypothetical protein